MQGMLDAVAERHSPEGAHKAVLTFPLLSQQRKSVSRLVLSPPYASIISAT